MTSYRFSLPATGCTTSVSSLRIYSPLWSTHSIPSSSAGLEPGGGRRPASGGLRQISVFHFHGPRAAAERVQHGPQQVEDVLPHRLPGRDPGERIGQLEQSKLRRRRNRFLERHHAQHSPRMYDFLYDSTRSPVRSCRCVNFLPPHSVAPQEGPCPRTRTHLVVEDAHRRRTRSCPGAASPCRRKGRTASGPPNAPPAVPVLVRTRACPDSSRSGRAPLRRRSDLQSQLPPDLSPFYADLYRCGLLWLLEVRPFLPVPAASAGGPFLTGLPTSSGMSYCCGTQRMPRTSQPADKITNLCSGLIATPAARSRRAFCRAPSSSKPKNSVMSSRRSGRIASLSMPRASRASKSSSTERSR